MWIPAPCLRRDRFWIVNFGLKVYNCIAYYSKKTLEQAHYRKGTEDEKDSKATAVSAERAGRDGSGWLR
jgi:hypothetical protein